MTEHDDPIIDYFDKELEQREKRLHAAYRNRDLLEFTHGAEWFYKHVYDIHHDYGWPVIKTNKPGPNAEQWEVELYEYTIRANQAEHHIQCWEIDNNYFRENIE